MLLQDKIERTQFGFNFEIIYDREKVKLIMVPKIVSQLKKRNLQAIYDPQATHVCFTDIIMVTFPKLLCPSKHAEQEDEG
jgi:hypothetical protein